MRKALNDNPVAQIAVLAGLAVVVAFMLMTRVANNGGESSTSTTASEAAATPAPAIDTASTTPSAAADVAPDVTPSDGTVPPGSLVSEFVAGPGLPAPLVKAYEDDKTVVLLVQRRRGIDDERLRQNVEPLGGKNGVGLFVTNAGHIARYSRITQGVNLARVPALIVLRPRHLTKGMPEATLSYGFRGPESVEQAIRDARYKGPSHLPYHPR